MQPPEQPAGAKTCSIQLSALSKLLPEGLMFGGAIDNGDCFFDAVCQVLRALDSSAFGKLRAVDVRHAVKSHWDAKSDKVAKDDFDALKYDESLMLPSCITSFDGFKRWLALPADFIKQRAQRQKGQAGFEEFATSPYWGGIMDFQVAELLVFLTMNEADCTLQSLWEHFNVSFHVFDISGSKSQCPDAKLVKVIGKGTRQV
jgi:hypothetical protein